MFDIGLFPEILGALSIIAIVSLALAILHISARLKEKEHHDKD